MPYIDLKISKKLDENQKEKIKSDLGGAISVLHKPESYLMVGIDDGYTLYFAGSKVSDGAYVSVSLFGSASSADYEKMTGEICKILSARAGLQPRNIYVTYRGVNDWGWSGSNF